MRVGDLDRVTLEKLLVNRVQEVLLVGKVGQVAGGALDGNVEGVQGAQVIVPAEALTNELIDDSLDLSGDDVSAREVGVAEDRAKQALGEQVLDEHLIHGRFAEVGVQSFPAEFEELLKCRTEGRIVVVRGLDDLLEAPAEVRDAVLEFGDRFFERLDFRLDMAVELIDDVTELFRVGEVNAHDLSLVLVEDRLACVLENDVRRGVAALDFLADFGFEVVAGVFSFPVAPRHIEAVADGAVGDDGASTGFGAQFADQSPAARAG